MSAAVTPLEARCEVCHGTGSTDTDFFGPLDCTHCTAADERVAMGKELGPMSQLAEIFAWRAYQLGKAAAAPVTVTRPELTVWYGPMPESNGKSNFTATLKRKDARPFDTNSYTFQRSEYPDRVLYEADCMRYLIGEIDTKPDILAYDADKHSGYAAPVVPVAAQPVVQQEPVAYMAFAENGNVRIWAGKNNLGAKEAAEAEGLVLQPVYAAPSLEAQPAGEVASAPNAALVAVLKKVRDYHINHHVLHEIDAALSAAGQEVGK